MIWPHSYSVSFAPPTLKSALDCTVFNPRQLRPFSHCVSFAINCYSPVVGTVILLNRHVYPSTIRWRIVQAIVDAVDTQTLFISILTGPLAKMVEPILAKPFIADSDSFAAIVLKQVIARIITPVLHVGVSSIQWCSERAVRSVRLNRPSTGVTSAALRVPTAKVITANNNCIATITQAFPCNLTVVISTIFPDDS